MEEVSDSAKLRIRSRNDGVEPVVMALILGMVMVGAVACAVNGIAEPLTMRLGSVSSIAISNEEGGGVPYLWVNVKPLGSENTKSLYH